ncbi:MAG: HEPN domain-containing protein [Truepera sp.]|nr:HEPN domain-containing protein [Truepera sp.]
MAEAKSEIVRQWLTRAERDLGSAERLAAGSAPYLDTAVYHCQQAGEKAVKGFLAFAEHELEKTHDVERLVKLAEAYEPAFQHHRSAARLLTPYATRFRYISEALEPSRDEFNEAFKAAEGLYHFTLSLLPEEVHP